MLDPVISPPSASKPTAAPTPQASLEAVVDSSLKAAKFAPPAPPVIDDKAMAADVRALIYNGSGVSKTFAAELRTSLQRGGYIDPESAEIRGGSAPKNQREMALSTVKQLLGLKPEATLQEYTAAVTQFQRENGLRSVDGKVGGETLGAILAKLGPPAQRAENEALRDETVRHRITRGHGPSNQAAAGAPVAGSFARDSVNYRVLRDWESMNHNAALYQKGQEVTPRTHGELKPSQDAVSNVRRGLLAAAKAAGISGIDSGSTLTIEKSAAGYVTPGSDGSYSVFGRISNGTNQSLVQFTLSPSGGVTAKQLGNDAALRGAVGLAERQTARFVSESTNTVRR